MVINFTMKFIISYTSKSTEEFENQNFLNFKKILIFDGVMPFYKHEEIHFKCWYLSQTLFRIFYLFFQLSIGIIYVGMSKRCLFCSIFSAFQMNESKILILPSNSKVGIPREYHSNSKINLVVLYCSTSLK